MGATYDGGHLERQGWAHRGAPGMLGLRRRKRLLIALLPLAAACGSHLKTQSLPAAPVSPAKPAAALASAPVAAPVPVTDPVLTLIASSNSYFVAGQRDLGLGHFE